GPAALLAVMNRSIKHSLGQHTAEGASDDGLEMAICKVFPDEGRMVFAGARMSLFHSRDGALEELKGDRPAMGYRHIPAEQTYTNQTLMVEPGQRFYLVSDGFIDQVGGPKHRMLGKKRLADLITACWDQPFAAQKDEILAAFHAYRGEESQRDDLSMVGFTLG
ncbi:MAG: SpoIIE family protein phosphatase, partial [Rhodobacterales bacterium]|nr:SpoIIE family protein phosphatase [Rhodobacterales bacterium]